MNEPVHSPHCQEFLGNISDYIDGELQAELCAEIEAHMRECENCRVVVNTLRKTVELYEQVEGPEALPAGVRERLFLRLNLDDFVGKPEE
jgi:anti-sigma factor RsiW